LYDMNVSILHHGTTWTSVFFTNVGHERQYFSQLYDMNVSIFYNCTTWTSVFFTIVRHERQYFHNCTTWTSVFFTIVRHEQSIFFTIVRHKRQYFSQLYDIVRHVTGTGSGLLGEIPRVVVQISALT
jgi:hypothetical protein